MAAVRDGVHPTEEGRDSDARFMLNLLEPTPTSWVERAYESLPQLLSDHAHCELKAAQSALSMVGRFGGEAPELVAPLVALAKEETQHFHMVHERLEAVGEPLAMPAADQYVRRLRKVARQDHGEAPPLLDRLLVSAFIEARSCERFKCLAEGLPDEGLRDFYRALMASEARHYRLFSGLAEQRFGAQARDRMKRIAQREAEVAADLPLGPTVHG